MASHPIPPPGHIHLILHYHIGADTVYLEVPIEVVRKNSLNHRKYLRYLGYSVLGIEGVLLNHQTGTEVTSDDLVDQAIYRYHVPGINPIARAVDVDVIIPRSHTPSTTTSTRDTEFRAELDERDGVCVWTGLVGVQGIHIIPFRRGDEWLQLIINNRRQDNLEEMSINDIRNGFLSNSYFHNTLFDPRNVALLKTPNPILTVEDIPPLFRRAEYAPGVSYPPDGSRYTMQWIKPPLSSIDNNLYPNNNDATFKDHTKPKPSDLLLHYNYGAAVMQAWGRNGSVLENRPDKPRPSPPELAPAGPERKKNDRTITLNKWRDNQQASGSGRNVGGAAAGEALDEDDGADLSEEEQDVGNQEKLNEPNAYKLWLDAQEPWDVDDLMMYLSMTTPYAQERLARKEMERKRAMEEWRLGISS